MQQIVLIIRLTYKYWYIGYSYYNSAVKSGVLGGAGVDAYTGEVEQFAEDQ